MFNKYYCCSQNFLSFFFLLLTKFSFAHVYLEMLPKGASELIIKTVPDYVY